VGVLEGLAVAREAVIGELDNVGEGLQTLAPCRGLKTPTYAAAFAETVVEELSLG
jgi:hypothetical protein